MRLDLTPPIHLTIIEVDSGRGDSQEERYSIGCAYKRNHGVSGQPTKTYETTHEHVNPLVFKDALPPFFNFGVWRSGLRVRMRMIPFGMRIVQHQLHPTYYYYDL